MKEIKMENSKMFSNGEENVIEMTATVSRTFITLEYVYEGTEYVLEIPRTESNKDIKNGDRVIMSISRITKD